MTSHLKAGLVWKLSYWAARLSKNDILSFKLKITLKKDSKEQPVSVLHQRNIFQTFWKPHCCAKFLFTCWVQILAIFYFFKILLNCAKFERDWTKLILVILGRSIESKNIKGGRTFIKWLRSTLSNLVQTLHSSAKLK